MRSVPRGSGLGIIKDFLMDNPKLITSAFGLKFGAKEKIKGDRTIEEFIHDKLHFGPIKLNGLADFLSDYFANAVF